MDRAAVMLGFPPALRMEGLIDTDVPPGVADEIIAVIGEALTNVARHAQAAHAEVLIKAEDGAVTVEVSDDGIGISDDGRRSGLLNLAERAGRLEGELSVGPGIQGGTRLVWRVPVVPGVSGGAVPRSGQ
jgi:signal transduction histidine kinase